MERRPFDVFVDKTGPLILSYVHLPLRVLITLSETRCLGRFCLVKGKAWTLMTLAESATSHYTYHQPIIWSLYIVFKLQLLEEYVSIKMTSNVDIKKLQTFFDEGAMES